MKKFFKNVKYLLEYFFVVIILEILGVLGIDKSTKICRYIAKKIGPLLAVNKVAKENIQNIFSKLYMPNQFQELSKSVSVKQINDIQQRQFLKSKGYICSQTIISQVWDNFGNFVGEFPYVNKMSEEELSKRVEIIGLNNIIEFQRLHQPFLLFTGHFANWDFVLKIINKFYPKFAIIYRKSNNPYVDKLINDTRKSSGIKLIPKGVKGVRDLISVIKSGYAVGMLVDQKMNNGIDVPFLDHPAMTGNAIAKIALQFSYPIIPLQIIRVDSNNSYFKAIIHSPIQLQRTNDNKIDCYNIMFTINQILGNWVKENPGQWFWFHNRWNKKLK